MKQLSMLFKFGLRTDRVATINAADGFSPVRLSEECSFRFDFKVPQSVQKIA